MLRFNVRLKQTICTHTHTLSYRRLFNKISLSTSCAVCDTPTYHTDTDTRRDCSCSIDYICHKRRAIVAN